MVWQNERMIAFLCHPFFNPAFSLDMKRLISLILLGCLAISYGLMAQSVGINATGNTPDPSAMLDVQSTTQGVLVPRMDSTERKAINAPATGLLVYDLDTQSFWFHTLSGWKELIADASVRLADDDGNTQIQVEEGINDNTIRFDVNGDEAMVLSPNGELTLKGNNPNDPGFMALLNGDSTQFVRLFSGTGSDPDPYVNWEEGSDLRFVTTNFPFTSFTERMRISAGGRLGIGTPSPQAGFHLQNQQMLMRGDFVNSYSGAIPDSGAGTRLMWVPEKAAFRAGLVNGTQWDLASMGDFSAVAGGLDGVASGLAAFVGGGAGDTASGNYSFVAGGQSNHAVGPESFVGGGFDNTAVGNTSFIGGGLGLTAPSFAESVFGYFNTDYVPSSTSSFVGSDRLFVVGNGTGNDPSDRANALTLLKNGNLGLGTSTPQAQLHVQSGQVLMTGGFVSNYSGPIPASGIGTRLMWIPEKAAFRVGTVNGNQWDMANIGDYSAVVGGPSSIALGDYAVVVGGFQNFALANASFVGGGGVIGQTGGTPTSFGPNQILADGFSSFIAGGSNNLISGSNSFIGGGRYNTAEGIFSFNGGGFRNTAASFCEAVFGLYAEEYPTGNTPNLSSFEADDRLFVVGNGTSSTRSNALTILKNGNVGVGESNPTQAKLVVDGVAFPTPIPSPYIYGAGGAAGPFGTTFPNLSGYFSGFVASEAFFAFSDQRIKDILGVSDREADLRTLMGIKVTDYRMRDTLIKGSQVIKKVIAQQVADVYPQAVTSNLTDVIPDIYQRAEVQDGWIMLATDLQVGERVKLISEEGNRVYKVIRVEEGRFQVSGLATRSETVSPLASQVFVYGREVNDFHTVDYEAIAMLNVSATQAQQKLIEAQQEEIKALKTELQALKNLEARLEQLEQGLHADLQP